MKQKLLTVFTILASFLLVSTAVGAVNSNFNTGIGRNGNSGLNISADTPGPIKYHLEFKPLGGSRQVSINDYNDTSKNMAMTVNVNCLDGSGCSDDETLVRGIYIAGEEDGYAVAKRFTLFCGSIQVTGEQKTDNWDDAFYKSFADDFLNNGPSAGNCPSPTTALSPTIVVGVTSATATPTPAKRNQSFTPTLAEEEEDQEPTPANQETPTPTPDEDQKNMAFAGFTQNLPAIIAALVLVGVLGFVLYRTNPKFRAFVQNFTNRSKKKEEVIPEPTSPAEPPTPPEPPTAPPEKHDS